MVCVAGALVAAVGGCGDEPSGESAGAPPAGALAQALNEVGGGGAGSIGVGWADPRLVERSGAGPRLVAEALGPNAGTVIEAAAPIQRRFRFDPLAARRLISIGGSYAFGLRLDGPDGRPLRHALVAAGGRARRSGELELVDIGDYAVVPEPLLQVGVHGLGARDAFGPRVTVLAISESARAALLGRGERLSEEPSYRAAAGCLGDVVAARIVPDKLLLSTEQGVDLLAVGVAPERELLCVLGGTAERAAAVASGLEASLAPDARDPLSGEPIGDTVVGAEVTRSSDAGVEVVRAELTLRRGERPGFVFGAIAGGSLVELINGG